MKTCYAFCEAVTAGSQSRWHIRPLTPVGLKSGGGVDTPSLCGHVKPPYGWDLAVPIDEHHLSHACRECVRLYREAKPDAVRPLEQITDARFRTAATISNLADRVEALVADLKAGQK